MEAQSGGWCSKPDDDDGDDDGDDDDKQPDELGQRNQKRKGRNRWKT